MHSLHYPELDKPPHFHQANTTAIEPWICRVRWAEVVDQKLVEEAALSTITERCRRATRGVGMRLRSWANAALLGVIFCMRLTVSAQYSGPATPAPYNPIALAEVTGVPRTAVQAGHNNNLTLSQNPYFGGVLATDAITDARGQHWQALSELLPNVVTDTGFGVHQLVLKAQIGLSIRGVPPVVGPFGYFDSRAYLTQSVFDWGSIQRVRSSDAQLRSAEFNSKDARELVVLAIVSNYLLAIANQSEVESATSQRDTAKALFQQATDQKTAGLASAVDVLRSQVQLKSREQRLSKYPPAEPGALLCEPLEAA